MKSENLGMKAGGISVDVLHFQKNMGWISGGQQHVYVEDEFTSCHVYRMFTVEGTSAK